MRRLYGKTHNNPLKAEQKRIINVPNVLREVTIVHFWSKWEEYQSQVCAKCAANKPINVGASPPEAEEVETCLRKRRGKHEDMW
jgi:hypothetical protein